jgi:hypothetical protein
MIWGVEQDLSSQQNQEIAVGRDETENRRLCGGGAAPSKFPVCVVLKSRSRLAVRTINGPIRLAFCAAIRCRESRVLIDRLPSGFRLAGATVMLGSRGATAKPESWALFTRAAPAGQCA